MALHLTPLQVIASEKHRRIIAEIADGEGVSQASVVRDCLDEALPTRHRRHKARMRRKDERND